MDKQLTEKDLIELMKEIIAKGNDVEIRRGKDGVKKVYEIKKVLIGTLADKE